MFVFMGTPLNIEYEQNLFNGSGASEESKQTERQTEGIPKITLCIQGYLKSGNPSKFRHIFLSIKKICLYYTYMKN
jgi:hypothetical protein